MDEDEEENERKETDPREIARRICFNLVNAPYLCAALKGERCISIFSHNVYNFKLKSSLFYQDQN